MMGEHGRGKCRSVEKSSGSTWSLTYPAVAVFLWPSALPFFSCSLPLQTLHALDVKQCSRHWYKVVLDISSPPLSFLEQQGLNQGLYI